MYTGAFNKIFTILLFTRNTRTRLVLRFSKFQRLTGCVCVCEAGIFLPILRKTHARRNNRSLQRRPRKTPSARQIAVRAVAAALYGAVMMIMVCPAQNIRVHAPLCSVTQHWNGTIWPMGGGGYEERIIFVYIPCFV